MDSFLSPVVYKGGKITAVNHSDEYSLVLNKLATIMYKDLNVSPIAYREMRDKLINLCAIQEADTVIYGVKKDIDADYLYSQSPYENACVLRLAAQFNLEEDKEARQKIANEIAFLVSNFVKNNFESFADEALEKRMDDFGIFHTPDDEKDPDDYCDDEMHVGY